MVEPPAAYNRTLEPAPTHMSVKLMLPVSCPRGCNNESYPSVVEEHTSETKISIRSTSIPEVSDSSRTIFESKKKL